ncbi:hypothetical protein BDR04DRAFT_1156585 [Suillus decipiens]|nr:hypothetical protein BDR04DRAFT_1156585 [Suillus decipiens]
MDTDHLPLTHPGYTSAQFSVPPHTRHPAAPTYAPATPDSSPETALTKVVEDAQNPDFIQGTAFVAPGLPSSQVQEIALAEAHEELDFWRRIDEIEEFVDPVLPIPESPSSPSLETMLAKAAEDPDVWRFINRIEESVDPELLCMSLTDAVDPDFCNFPIRTLLVCSWLNNSYGNALHQRPPSELAPLSPTLIDREM